MIVSIGHKLVYSVCCIPVHSEPVDCRKGLHAGKASHTLRLG